MDNEEFQENLFNMDNNNNDATNESKESIEESVNQPPTETDNGDDGYTDESINIIIDP